MHNSGITRLFQRILFFLLALLVEMGLAQESLVCKTAELKIDQLYDQEQLDSVIYYEKVRLSCALSATDTILAINVFYDLGYAFSYQDQLDSSNVYLHKGLQLSNIHSQKDIQLESQLEYNIAYNFQLKGDYNQSINYLQNAERKLESIDAIHGIDFADIIAGLGTLFYQKTDYYNALKYFSKALHRYQKLEKEAERLLPFCYDQISLIHYHLGNIDLAEEFSKQSILLFESLKERDPKLYSYALNNAALVSISKKEFVLADLRLQTALKLAESANVSIEYTYLNLGFLNFNKENWEKAAAYFKMSLRLFKAKYTYHPHLGKIHYYLGQIHLENGRYLDALTEYQLAFTQLVPDFQSKNVHQHPAPSSLTSSARTLMMTMRQKAIALSKLSITHPEFVTSALDAFDKAIVLTDNIRQSLKSEQSKLFLMEETGALFDEAIAFCYHLYERDKEQRFLEKGFEYVEKSRSPLLLGEWMTSNSQLSFGVPIALLNREMALKTDLAFFQKQLLKARERNDSTKILTFENQLFSKTKEFNALQDELRLNYPKYHQHKYANETVSLSELQGTLPPKSQLFEFYMTEEAVFLLSILPNSSELFRIPFGKSEEIKLSEFVNALKQPETQSMTFKQSLRLIKTNGYDLYNILLRPFIDSTAKRLIISPDKQLHHCSFDALVSTDSNDDANFLKIDYLINSHSISYTSSSTLFTQQMLNSPFEGTKELLALAPFQHSSQPIIASRSHPGALPGTKQEVDKIRKLFNTDVLSNGLKNKSEFQKGASQYRLLHLATHGVSDTTNSMAYFVFSEEGYPESEAAYLYNYEIENMTLNAELAVLSACETGVGKIDNYEGSLNLARGFFYAGIPGVLLTQWKIDDQSSSYIISRFYENINNGKPKDVSIREAKLEFLKTTADPISAHPFYWAGFSMWGSVASLQTDSGFPKSNVLVILIIVGSLIMGLLYFSRSI